MRFLKRLFDKIRAVVGRPAAYAAAEWRRMSPRERRLISILGGAFATCALVLVAYGFMVNMTKLDFSRLMGLYIVIFFLVAQAVAMLMLGPRKSSWMASWPARILGAVWMMKNGEILR